MILVVVTIFATTLLVAGSLTAGLDEQSVFAKIKKSNNSIQGIGQETLTGQEAVCDSLEDNLASCNNVGLSLNLMMVTTQQVNNRLSSFIFLLSEIISIL